MTTYDFLLANQTIQINVQTDFNLTQFLFWSTFGNDRLLGIMVLRPPFGQDVFISLSQKQRHVSQG